jgi:hypothetical protein
MLIKQHAKQMSRPVDGYNSDASNRHVLLCMSTHVQPGHVMRPTSMASYYFATAAVYLPRVRNELSEPESANLYLS